jgi:hypothetical protein
LLKELLAEKKAGLKDVKRREGKKKGSFQLACELRPSPKGKPRLKREQRRWMDALENPSCRLIQMHAQASLFDHLNE